MFHYPSIDPVAVHLGPLAVHWYGLMYLLSFIIGWSLAYYRTKHHPQSQWNKEQLTDLLFYVAIGVVFGGRIGYVLFYDFHYFIYHPWFLLEVWQGGMSFHGGLLGVILACWFWARKQQCSLFDVTDFIAPIVPVGLAAGRLGNFINGELFGRVTTMPWGIIYPNGGPLPRHPSELYEFLLEGVLLFIILWVYSNKARPRMAVSGMFLLLYGCVRFFLEFFREPDAQLGFLAWGWLTRGMELTLPMILIGVILLWLAYRKPVAN